MGSPNKPAAQFILDMDPDDLLERAFRRKPQLPRATRVEAAGPAGDDVCDRRIGFGADAFGRVVARDFAQSLDLLGHRRGDARHGQVAPSPESVAVEATPGLVLLLGPPSPWLPLVRGRHKEPRARGARACQCTSSSGAGN